MNVIQKVSILSLVFMGATLSHAAQEHLVPGLGILPIVKIEDKYFVMMRYRRDGTIGTVGGSSDKLHKPATRECAICIFCGKSSYTKSEVFDGMGNITTPLAQSPLYALYGAVLDGKQPGKKDRYNVLVPVENFAQALLSGKASSLVSKKGHSYPVWAPTQELFKTNKWSLLGYLVGAISGWEGIDLSSSAQEAQDH